MYISSSLLVFRKTAFLNLTESSSEIPVSGTTKRNQVVPIIFKARILCPINGNEQRKKKPHPIFTEDEITNATFQIVGHALFL